MIFEQSFIAGVWRIELERRVDSRGFFARTFCADEFTAHGLSSIFEQTSLAHNVLKGTLRGMHYQLEPNGETKLIRCVRGSVYDVAIDLREGSPTEGRWIGEILSQENGVALYVSPGIAHGYLTLTDEADILYQITPQFKPGSGAGVRWNDPSFGVAWPVLEMIMSDQDLSYPDWKR